MSATAGTRYPRHKRLKKITSTINESCDGNPLHSVLIGALLLSACGGDGGAGQDIVVVQQPGRFLDVEGLAYESGSQTGITGALGEFRYEATHQECYSSSPHSCTEKPTPAATTFKLMADVALPAPPPPWVDWPIELDADELREPKHLYNTWHVSPPTLSADPIVQTNVALVLHMADADGDPANGIQIPRAVREGTYGGRIDWSAPDTRTAFAALQEAIRALDPSGTHEWPATDDLATAHFGRVLNCAQVGRYNIYLQKPEFTDTSGSPSRFDGREYALITPTAFSGLLWFTSSPWQFEGVFRFNGALSPSPTATYTTHSVQYVDAGEFAPEQPYSPPIDLITTLSIGAQGAVAGNWTGGGYTGPVDSGRLYAPSVVSTDAEHLSQPIHAQYRFMVYPLWITKPANLGGPSRAEFVWQLDIDTSGKVYGSLVKLNDSPDTEPTVAEMGSAHTLSIAHDEKNTTSPYEWRFEGTLNPSTVKLTGTFAQWDGSRIVWDDAAPLIGCSTRGEGVSP